MTAPATEPTDTEIRDYIAHLDGRIVRVKARGMRDAARKLGRPAFIHAASAPCPAEVTR